MGKEVDGHDGVGDIQKKATFNSSSLNMSQLTAHDCWILTSFPLLIDCTAS